MEYEAFKVDSGRVQVRPWLYRRVEMEMSASEYLAEVTPTTPTPLSVGYVVVLRARGFLCGGVTTGKFLPAIRMLDQGLPERSMPT